MRRNSHESLTVAPRGYVSRGCIRSNNNEEHVDGVDLPKTKDAPPDTPLQSFARLGTALSEKVLGRKFWYEKPKMAQSFLSSEKHVVICEAHIRSGSLYTYVNIVDALWRRGLENVIMSNGWEVSIVGKQDSHDLCEGCAKTNSDLDLRRESSTHATRNMQEYSRSHDLASVGKALHKIYDSVSRASCTGSFVLAVGGDRCISTAVTGGVLSSYKNLSVIFVSAFADCNTPRTSPSREYHGMTAAHIMGWFDDHVEGFDWMRYNVPENRVAVIGLRDCDADEMNRVSSSGLRIFSMHQISRYGIGAVVEMVLKTINPRNDRPIHLSFDLSACDNKVFGSGLDSCGGLTLREARYICSTLSQTNALVSMDIVHMKHNSSQVDVDRSAHVALTLISSAVGRRII